MSFYVLFFCSVIITYLLTGIEFSLGGSSSYTSTDKTRINLHKLNNTRTQYKQYKSQSIQVHVSVKNELLVKAPAPYKTVLHSFFSRRIP